MLEDNYFTKEYIFDKIPIRFMLTEKCNLRCHMCSADGLGIGKVNCNQSKEMDIEKAKILVDLLSEINYSGEITFSGGEPMVYPYFYELIEYILKNNRNTVKVITNGTIPFKENFFTDRKKAQISIHSLDYKSWNKITQGNIIQFNNLVKNLEKMNKEQVHNINVVIHKGINDSNEELFSLFEFSKNNNFHLRLFKLFPYTENMYDKYKDINKEYLNDLKLKKSPNKVRWHNQDEYSQLERYYFNDNLNQEIDVASCPCFSGECSSCYKWHFLQITSDLKIKTCLERENYIDLNEAIIKKDSKLLLKKIIESRIAIFNHGKESPPLRNHPFFNCGLNTIKIINNLRH